jgi:large subunit ribosomal protein L24
MAIVASKQPRKQRKGRYNAPIHVRSRFLSAPLAAALREKYGTRTIRVVKGDTVKVLRGDFAGEEGLVDAVNTANSTLLVHEIALTKADGKEVPRPIHASNVQVIKLVLTDKRRAEKLGGSE